MIELKKSFVLKRSEIAKKFRVENNNLDTTALMQSTGYAVKRIFDVAYAHRTERNRKTTASDTFRYVQISDIDVSLGRIKSFRSFRGDLAPNNARRIIQEGDVLVSTRRPTRGAVVAVPTEFDSQICTVFFTTLKIRDRREIDPRYMALFLRTSLGRYQFSSLITETAYPVISDEDVESMTILVPPLEEQTAIADSYDQEVSNFFARLNDAYRLISQAQQGIEKAVLGEHAEFVPTKTFGLVEEAEIPVPEEEEEVAV